jgi:predicted alpha/beta-hydrolase family hydrolase
MGDVIDIETPHGIARAHVTGPDQARALVVLGHGAGGGVAAPDLVAIADSLVQRGIAVARVEQPYRVQGRRAPAPARQLDAVWAEVVAVLRARHAAGTPVVSGGRSSGARVACRTAGQIGAVGVLCLAFPVQPRARKGKAVSSRMPELEAVAVPTLVVQGRRDPFGMPPAAPARMIMKVDGDHSLKADLRAAADAVTAWIERLLTGR